MDAEFSKLENFKMSWPAWPKNRIFELPCVGARTAFCFAREADRFQILASIVVGKRGGIWEALTVVDPTQKILIDQLVMSATTDDSDGFLFSVEEMRAEIRSGVNYEDVCLGHITRLIECATTDPVDFLARIKTALIPDSARNSIGLSRIIPGSYGSRQ